MNQKYLAYWCGLGNLAYLFFALSFWFLHGASESRTDATKLMSDWSPFVVAAGVCGAWFCLRLSQRVDDSMRNDPFGLVATAGSHLVCYVWLAVSALYRAPSYDTELNDSMIFVCIMIVVSIGTGSVVRQSLRARSQA